jgi:heavy metal efflux system protein
MIQKLVAFALRLPFVVWMGALVILVGGTLSYLALDIEAYPNPVPPLVEVITQPDGASPEEVERYVTIPLEIGLAGMPGLDHVRSQSLFGLSDVKCYFKWGTQYADARQEVINRLGFVALPSGVQASISPWNAIGEIYRYTLKGKGYTLRDFKTAEDWILERQFKQVPGVVDVTSFGGETMQYHVGVDPFRLRDHSVSLAQLITAIQNANTNVGGQRLVLGEQSYNVRGIGLLKDTHDIDNIVVTERSGTPTRVRDVATTSEGAAPRLGQVGHDGDDDVVQGIVLMRYGGETPAALKGVHDRIDHIHKYHLLPPGMDIEPYYDRGDLVKLTTHTVLENVITGMILVTLVLLLFLGHLRAALITAINIPLALLIAFGGLVITGTSANLISIGAVDFGIVVDSTVIMMENIFQHLGKHGKGTIGERILEGAREVASPMTFSTVIIGVAFLPLFTMTGVAGVIFGPMARTYAFAIGGAILLALTLTPVLSSKFIPAQTEEEDSKAMQVVHKIYSPLFNIALKTPKRALLIASPVIALGITAMFFLGSEFMPKLEEGNLWIRVTLPTSISLQETGKFVPRMRDILRGCPTDNTPCTDQNRKHKEVVTVVSQNGRPDDGTDVAGFNNVEFFVPLAPFDEWPRGYTKDNLTDDLSKELSDAFPGASFGFSQYINDNVEEALSGVKGENSVKIIGPDLNVNEDLADKILDVMQNIKGIKDLGMFHSLGQPNVKIVPDRTACARYGLNTGDVEQVVQAAIGGQAVTQVFQGEKHFDLTVRFLEPYRNSIEAIREITIATPDGGNIALGQISTITQENGPSLVYREDGSRYAPIKFSVRGRDLKSTIAEAQAKINDQVHLPYDTHLEWGGEINELNEAFSRLAFIVPLTLILIAFLAYTAVKSWVDTIIVLINIPVACTGGALALFVTSINFSVSAAMGFISILGIAVQDAILVVTYFQRIREDQKCSVREAAREAAEKRLRPCLMTTLVAMIGLFPAAISTGIGAQTQKPLAVVVIGGAMLLAVLTRIMQPALLVIAHEWVERRKGARNSHPAAIPPDPTPAE